MVKQKAQKKKKKSDAEMMFVVGDVKVVVTESFVRDCIDQVTGHPLVKETLDAVMNKVRPMDDVDLKDFIKKKKKK